MNEDADSCDENVLYRRERLPSIVVEPTEHIQLQSDHPGWARACSSSSSLEEETGCGEDAGSSEDKDAAAEPGYSLSKIPYVLTDGAVAFSPDGVSVAARGPGSLPSVRPRVNCPSPT